jgi:hypothetical protein
MAYSVKGVPEWVYAIPKMDLRTVFTERPEGWNPWVSEADALEALAELKERGVEVDVRTWSGKTTYSDLSAPVKRAIDRNKLRHKAGTRGTLYGCRVGGWTSGWAVEPTLGEAVGRAVMASAKTKGLGA